MIGTIFGILILTSVAYAAFTGGIEALGEAALTGAAESVTLVLALLGTIGFWTALMRVFRDGGVTGRFGRLLAPLMRLLYPSAVDKDVLEALTASFLANLFGLGSAAMPSGITAAGALQKRAARADTASDEVIRFAVLASVPPQLFPSTLIALRLSDGDTAPYRLLFPIWCAQAATFIFAVTVCGICSRVCQKGAS